MNERVIEFGIVYLRRIGNHLFVSGRCSRGPIAISDTFRYVYSVTPQPIPEGYGPPQREDHQPLSLRVESITAYKHSLKELSTGMTAEIELSGNGFELVREGLFLGNSKES